MRIRYPVFSGRFYPSSLKDIAQAYESVLSSENSNINYNLSEEKLMGAIMPHAGFMYCGYQAVHVLEVLKSLKKKPETVIIINPNHTAYGDEISIDNNEIWRTPVKDSKLDLEFVNRLGLSISDIAHQYEHSAEAILPFLQYVLDVDFQIVPICLSKQNYMNAKKLAELIYNVNQILKKKIFVIASSDFSHFVSPDHSMDRSVISSIKALETKTVERDVQSKQLSICGYGPIMCLMEYSKMISEHPKVHHLSAGHSGNVQPAEEVVHYHSFLFCDE